MVCASVAQFGTNAVLTFFLIDFVNYLIVQRHMTFLNAGFFAALPYMAAAVGGVVGGQISDRLLKNGKGANLARKLPIVMGLLLAACLPIVSYIPADQNGLVIFVMSVVFFGQGASNLGWTVLSDIAPRQLVGLSAGFFNLITNLSGIITPIAIGIILQYTGSYDLSFAFIGALPLLGALLYIFAMGDIKRMEFTE
jgi:ACS family D-galactonate transporter-like MFS transporter